MGQRDRTPNLTFMLHAGGSALILACLLGMPLCAAARVEASYAAGWDDIADFLGGIPPANENLRALAEGSAAWRTHSSWMDRFWLGMEARALSPINAWRVIHMPTGYTRNTAVYPLSGADFINLYAFFPAARSYVMISLEKPGSLPRIGSLGESEIRLGLRSITRAIASMHYLNYLGTTAQEEEMGNRVFPGTLPILLAFAARLDLSVLDVRHVRLERDGTLVNTGAATAHRGGADGYRILFTQPESRDQREIIYMCARITPFSMDPSRPVGTYLRGLGAINTLIKSAVYLLHLRSFRNCCEALMEQSGVIVQDYSGIPYRYFSGTEWEKRLFGRYDRPAAFPNYPDPPHQADLLAAYKTPRPEVPFCFGYGAIRGCGNSCLMLMVKR